jgi:hypothetical protein
MSILDLVPAYGRDYKSREALLADWRAGKDFREPDGRHVNSQDVDLVKAEGYKYLNVRYKCLQEVCVIKL